MLLLKHQAFPPAFERFLTPLPESLRKLAYVSFTCGLTHWKDLLSQPNGTLLHFQFLDASHPDFDHAGALANLGTVSCAHIGLAIAALHKHHEESQGEGPAIVLRRHAYIVLAAAQTGQHLYVPLPGVSAHETIADQAMLELDFPNRFQVI